MAVSDNELSRQYRLLSQMLTFHATLRDRYLKRSAGLDIVLLICSTIFCATSFANDDIFNWLGFTPPSARNFLRVIAVAAFMTSVISLRVDWRGKAARHSDANKRLSASMALFRESRTGENKWLEEKKEALNSSYWGTMNSIVEIPDRQFAKLKAKHLRKINVSKALDDYPGCPASVISIILSAKAAIAYLNGTKAKSE